MLTETDAEGNTTTSTYDACGRVATSTDALGNTTAHTYDAAGREIATTDPRGNVTTSTYDAAGRVVATTDALGNTTTYDHDANGNQVAQTDPLGNTTTSTYDSMNRLVSTTDPEGRTVSYTYDRNGNKTSTTDGTGAVTTFEYNAMGMLVKVTDPVGSTVTYAYDEAGRRTSMTDPGGEKTTYTYDSAGRLTHETNPLMETASFTYDEAGKMTTKTDGEGTTTFTYDASGNMTSVEYPGGLSETATYDRNNRPTGRSGDGITLSMSYDPAGRMLSASDGTTSTSATYDPSGNMTAKTLTLPGGEKNFTYTFNELNQMTVASGEQGSTAFTYSPSGRLIQKGYPNGIETHYGYDTGGSLSSLNVEGSSGTIKTYRVERDGRGNMTSVTEDGTQRTAYTYDASSRLTGEDNPWMGNTTYTYDPSGNRLSREKQGETPLTYTYNPANQLTEDSLGNTYTYNSRGDMVKIEKGDYQREYEFDGKGRLTAISDTEGMALDYTYDPADRTHTSKENGTTTTHAYDMNTDREIATINEDLTLNTLFHMGADGLISSTTDSTTSYFTYNPHSDVSLLTDETGNKKSELHYDAWGNMAEETDETYTYLGKHQRPTYRSPGLIKMGARFYDPDTGRFISRDPMKGNDTSPITRNRYTYANDDPANMVDLNGLSAIGPNNPQCACVGEPGAGTVWSNINICSLRDFWYFYRNGSKKYFDYDLWVQRTVSVDFKDNNGKKLRDGVRIRYVGIQIRLMESSSVGSGDLYFTKMKVEISGVSYGTYRRETYTSSAKPKDTLVRYAENATSYTPYKTVPEGEAAGTVEVKKCYKSRYYYVSIEASAYVKSLRTFMNEDLLLKWGVGTTGQFKIWIE